jgi:hypothetical protein
MAEFSNTRYTDASGRIERVATDEDEAKRLESEGFTKGGVNADTANAGREGNQKAAESSTTRVLKDGVDRTATSNA